jgi:hypothetical protein
MITRRYGFRHQAETYDPALPPPLCFTVPAGHRRGSGTLYVAGIAPLVPSKPHLMMDPSDPTTWQRPYVFTP